MSDTYTKVFSSITESTVWGEPYATRIVWVTMLAMADASGHVYGSIPGLARRGNVTLQEAEAALAAFMAPDPYSRTKGEEGRRIKEIDGGWLLINHAKYKAVRNAEERREYKREWDRENRPSGQARSKKSDRSPTQSDTSPTKTDSPAPPTPTPTPTPTPYTPESNASAERSLSAREPSQAADACIAMRKAGLPSVNASHPALLAALAAGATPAMFEDTTREALGHDPPKGFAWICATVHGRLRDLTSPTGPTRHAAHRPAPRDAQSRILANIAAGRERDEQQLDVVIEAEAVRVPR